MNTVEFRTAEFIDPATNRPVEVLSIAIDGTDLTDLVAQAELPFAEAEGSPSMAGQYRGLWIDYMAPPSRHLFGEPTHPVYRHDDKIQVLECECGEPGCWPLLCRISVADNRVTWSDFEQPHRKDKSVQPPWIYDRLGPFVFDHTAYQDALDALARQRDR